MRRKPNIRTIIAGLCITAGIAVMAVPFFYHFHGANETQQFMEVFEEEMKISENGEDTEYVQEKENTIKSKEKKKQTSDRQKKDALFGNEHVIGIIEIESLHIRYPILEGAGNEQIRYAIGHIAETAGIGEKGNCVLCGHNGSRNGVFFTTLNQIKKGAEVRLTNQKGEVFSYQVAETFIVEPNDNSVKDQTSEEMITLITCANKGTMRFICRCVPMQGGNAYGK